MTLPNDFGSSEFRFVPCEHSAPSPQLTPVALLDVQCFDGSGEQKVFPHDDRYCESYQPYLCSPLSDKGTQRYFPSEAIRSRSGNTVGGTRYTPVDVSCGLFSLPSRPMELCSADLGSKPFDPYGEAERLSKIQCMAEELVAREAAVPSNYRDVDLKEVGGVACCLTPETSPAKSPFPSVDSLLNFESSLMPLVEAADTSVRVSVQEASSGEGSAATTVEASKKQPPTESAGASSPPASDGPDVARGPSGTPGVRPSSAAATLSCGRRKKAVPKKSPPADDPNFKGAVVRMRLEMVNGKPKLKMEHQYNHTQRRGVLRPELSESEDEIEFARREDAEPQVLYKQCASCATKLTPLWRDAEDGTPLCNACGIRYKKYKVRCTRCWHIPRKNDNTGADCKECGGTLRFFARKSAN